MAGDNFEKIWVQELQNAVAIAHAMQAIQATGRALPCQVVAVNPNGPDGNPLGYGFVTIKLEVQFTVGGVTQTLPQITIPKAESQWMRAPTQVGDTGMTVPADTFLGGVSGLGTGIAQLDIEQGNLSNLVFIPIAATSFTAPADPNKAWINGPNGVEISDTARVIVLVVDGGTGTIQMAGSGGASGDALVRQSDLMAALTAYKAAEVGALIANAENIVVPTPTGSTKSFSR